ncbi:MAG TPA: hypothetical protein VFI42_09710 [Thermomicrobiaceae bacterium]|nr:hypothetical protein [Thermomicrobiaceae bacterium]
MRIEAHPKTRQTEARLNDGEKRSLRSKVGQRSSGRAVARRVFRLLAVVSLLTFTLVASAAAQGTPSITVVSPTPGEKITTTDIAVQVKTSDIDTACQWVGTPDKAGQGNIHAFLDKASLGTLINIYCGTDTFTIPGEGITPGQHTLFIDLASNTHADMADTMQKVEFDYEPATPKPLPAAKPAGATPTIQIVSPADGATVDSQLTLQLKWDNFTPTCDLEGKPVVAGYGHLHVVIDAEKASSPLAGLVAMPCQSSVPLDLSGWSAGQHTIMVALAQNDHTPVPNAQMASITVTLDNSAGAGGQVMPATGQPRSDAASVSPAIAVLTVFGIGLAAAGVTMRRRRTRNV